MIRPMGAGVGARRRVLRGGPARLWPQPGGSVRVWRRRRRWHPVDLPLVQLSRRIARSDATLAYDANEGLLVWLERLQSKTQDYDIKKDLERIKDDYRRLRYGRLSETTPDDPDYQSTLKALKTLVGKIR